LVIQPAATSYTLYATAALYIILIQKVITNVSFIITIVTNDKIVNKLIGKHMEGSSRGLIGVLSPVFAFMEQEKSGAIPVSVAGFRTEHLRNTSLDLYH
jgi:hypothetical protein